jgi:hypothetical protein
MRGDVSDKKEREADGAGDSVEETDGGKPAWEPGGVVGARKGVKKGMHVPGQATMRVCLAAASRAPAFMVSASIQ